VTSSNHSLPDDKLEQLLKSALPGVIPEPFPKFRYPAQVARKSTRWDTARISLAVSLCLLLGLGLVLPSGKILNQPASKAGSNLLQDSTADGRELLLRMNLEPAGKQD
jgi:hypothetical protein